MLESPIRTTGLDLNWSTIWDGIARTLPERTAVRSPGGATTYRQLESMSSRVASALHSSGVGRGDRVGLFLYNRIEYLVGMYAAFKLGAVPVNLNFRYRGTELAQLIEASGCAALVYPTSLTPAVTTALALRAVPLVIAVVDSATAPLPAACRWDEVVASEPPFTSSVPLSGEDRLFVFTGGTTGMPRAAVHRHGQLLLGQLVSIYGAAGIAFPTSLDDMLDIAANPDVPSPVTLPVTPLMHAMAMFNAMDTLVLGGTVVFLDSPSFDPRAVLQAIQDERVTRLIIAGNAVALPLTEALEASAAAGTRYDLASTELVMSSGMAWSDSVKARMLEYFDAQLFDIVGSSEGGPYAYSSVWSAGDLPSRLRLAADAVVLDADGREIDPASGGVGMLASRGPMPDGYFGDPAKTAQAYQHHGGLRYVVPGDWVRLFDGNTIEFLGRGSSVVNTGGEKVYPAEVEAALLALPEVVDCVVFGVGDERWGEVVAAVVQPVHPAETTAESLSRAIAGSLAGYKRPRRFAIVDSMHRSPSGKADITALRLLFTTGDRAGEGDRP